MQQTARKIRTIDTGKLLPLFDLPSVGIPLPHYALTKKQHADFLTNPISAGIDEGFDASSTIHSRTARFLPATIWQFIGKLIQTRWGSMDKSESTSHIATGSKVSIVRPQRLSHGTLLCANLTRSRRFYEEFLGLEVVRHAASAMMFRLHTGIHVVCVECGPEKLWDMHVFHHWGIDVDSHQAVDEAHQNAISYKDQYGIQKITKPILQHGAYSFFLRDLDRNWWEIQCPTLDHAAYFARGDVISMAP